MPDLGALARTILDYLGEDGLLPDLERCPCCGRGLVYVDGASGERRNGTFQVEVPDAAGVALYRECHACRARWHRYAEGHPLREYAEPWVARWPAYGRRPVADAWAEGVVRLPLEGRWVDRGGPRTPSPRRVATRSVTPSTSSPPGTVTAGPTPRR